MDKTRDPNPPKPVPVRKPDRLAREAEALRANLRKRKDQARQREDQREEQSDTRPDQDGRSFDPLA